MAKQIIHIASDYPQVKNIFPFIESDDNYHYLFYLSDKERVENRNNFSIYYVTEAYFQTEKFKQIYRESSLVIIHDLTKRKIRFLNKLNKRQTWIWIMWGNDYYTLFPQLYKNKLKKYTLLACLFTLKITPIKNTIKGNIQSFGKTKVQCEDQNLAARFDFYANNFLGYADLFKAIKVAKDRRLPSIYYSFDKSKSLNPEGRNILLGNSASVTQNHIDFLIQNRKTLLKQSNKVICPISYGSKRYAKTVELIGKMLLPNRIEFIKDYIDYEMFIENLRSCSYAVFNNQRAQAMGTVLLCFKMGMKVFLPKDSAMYSYFKSIGLEFFPISNFTPEIQDPLNEALILKNQSIVDDIFGTTSIQDNFKQIIQKAYV